MNKMKLSELQVGGYFKLADKAHKRNRLYEKSKWEYEDGLICHIPGSCRQFLFPLDSDIIEYDLLDAMADTMERIQRNSKFARRKD